MSGTGIWLTILFCGLVTLAIRASFIVLPPDTEVPAWLNGGLKFVAAAVLPALIVPDVLFRDLTPGHIVNAYQIIAAILAAAVALKTKSTFSTLMTGMVALWLLKSWGPF